MANPNPKTDHLQSTRWQPGESGNPDGKPKGTRNLASVIRDLMEDDGFEQRLKDGTVLKGAPIQAVIKTLIVKAVQGDMKAFDLLARYGYGTKVDVTTDGDKLPVPLMGGLSTLTTAQLSEMLESRQSR